MAFEISEKQFHTFKHAKIGGHMNKVKRIILLASISISFLALQNEAKAATSYNSISFKPVTDQGDYLTIDQSQTLGKWGYALGLMGEFSDDSVVAYNLDDTRLRDVVEKQIAMHVGGALGLLDWLNVGVLAGFVPYQQFNDVTTGVASNGARMSDIRLNFKARILNNNKYPVGIGVVPFVTFPTGKDERFVGNGNVTGGGMIVFDTKRFADRVSFATNVGIEGRKTAHLTPNTEIGTQLLYGGAANVSIIKQLQFIAEITGWTPFSKFAKKYINDLEGNGAFRWLPMKGLAVTAGGGAGIINGIGAPDYRVFASVGYRHPPEEKKVVTEEVIRVNNIHFEFDKAKVLPVSYPVVDTIAQLIKMKPGLQHVSIEGHTDSKGSDEYNMKLSDRRANAVMQELIKRGIPAAKLSAVGKGESVPIAPNTLPNGKDNPAGRAINRRVEFHLTISPDMKVRVEREDQPSPTFIEKGLEQKDTEEKAPAKKESVKKGSKK